MAYYPATWYRPYVSKAVHDAAVIHNLVAAVGEGANAGSILDDGMICNANGALVSRQPTEVNVLYGTAELDLIKELA